jgi:outer membrane protein OmpA-like peptidoglycan-associated protein
MKKHALIFALFFLPFFLAGQKKLRNPPIQEEVKIINASEMNSSAYDFAPTIYRNGIVFVTNRRKSGPLDENLGETFFELWYAELTPSGIPQKPELLSVQLNSRFHESAVAFNKEQDLIYLTRNHTSTDKPGGKSRMKIVEAKRDKNTWFGFNDLPFNSDLYSCMHPTLTPDGNTMFFASDMPGGIGGLDLYVVTKYEGQWQKPINLGPDINSPGNDVFPFYHPSGTLFFSSDGHRGLGGMDLFMIDMSKRQWGAVNNLGLPFNSEQDDLTFYLNADGNAGFFASSRPGGKGKDDIYRFIAPKGISGIEVPELRQISLKTQEGVKIHVFDKTGKENKDITNLYSAEWLPNGENFTFQLAQLQLGPPDYSTPIDGQTTLDLEANKDYLLILSKKGYKTGECNINTHSLKPNPLTIFLEEDDRWMLKGKTTTINQGRIIPNTQISIINEHSGLTDYIYTSDDGTFEYALHPNTRYTLVAEKQGYSKSTITVNSASPQSVTLELRPDPISDSFQKGLKSGTILILDDIQYDFNKSPIRIGEGRELIELAALMKKYPTLNIEIIAHTDTRGPESYNLQLSQNRAESAKRFLIQRNIDEDRIKTVGMGELYPRNHCIEGVPCSEQEHLFNQRLEIKITGLQQSIDFTYGQKGLIFK